jgi:hypothetical protein
MVVTGRNTVARTDTKGETKMNAMQNFRYEHNNSVTIASGLGRIVLTYKVKAEEEKNDPVAFLFQGLQHEEPARNERTYFEAVLYGHNGSVEFIGYGIVPNSALQSIYTQEANSRLQAELRMV